MNKRGFTLVELIVVMAVLAIMLIAAAPALNDWLKNVEYESVARDIFSGLREARSLAVTNHENITAELDLDAHQLTYNGKTRLFAEEITIEASNASASDADLVASGKISTVFRPQGSCSQTFFARVNEDTKLIIQLDSTATGLARLSQ